MFRGSWTEAGHVAAKLIQQMGSCSWRGGVRGVGQHFTGEAEGFSVYQLRDGSLEVFLQGASYTQKHNGKGLGPGSVGVAHEGCL